MLTKLPCCPACGEDELWLSKHASYVIVKCYYCGWNGTVIPRPTDDELGNSVAAVVQQERAIREAKGER